jgi:transcriptional regulator with XRE-family HTH domain
MLARIKQIHMITSDHALAQALNTSRATLVRVRNEEIPPSPAFMAALTRFTGLGLGEAFEIIEQHSARAAAAPVSTP